MQIQRVHRSMSKKERDAIKAAEKARQEAEKKAREALE